MKKYYLIILTFFSINAFASLGGYVLYGKVTKEFLDDKYISFESKDGAKFKIPKRILSKSEIPSGTEKSIALVKNVSSADFVKMRKECIDYFKSKYKYKENDAKSNCL